MGRWEGGGGVKVMFRLPSEKESTLKGKKLSPKGAKSFLFL